MQPVRTPTRADDGFRPWQFFVLAALGCATAATFIARGQGVTAVILLSVLMAGAGARRHCGAAHGPAAGVGATTIAPR